MRLTPGTSAAAAFSLEHSPLRVALANPHVDPRWEAFVLAHPEAGIYHHPAWLAALEREYGQQPMHLACEDPGGALVAVLPLLQTRGVPFRLGGPLAARRLSSLPRTPVCGPLFTNPEAAAAVLEAAVLLARRQPGMQLQLKTQSTQLDGSVEGLSRTSWRSSYVLELPGDPARLRFGNNVSRHRIKWAVNKARRLGLRVRPAEQEAELAAWYPLYLEAMRRNMVPARPYRFFQSIWRLLRPKGWIELLLAERSEPGKTRLLAGSLFLTFGRTYSYVFTGSRRQDLALHPNDLIQWHAIHDACAKGFRRYDFGEVPEDHQQLAAFKTKWGAEAVPLYRYYYPPPENPPPSGAMLPKPVQRLAASLWGRLPLRATAVLGDRIYSYL